ncbi:MAG: hypothetical protein HDT43_03560 [Ruminococcaceae bacterium]|nr:hypothetical protein [Oscillospiraceae bacterium]
MGMIDELKALGADTDDALTRFMGNTELFERMLKKLPKVVEEAPVMPYLKSGDPDMAMTNAHTLKGVIGNLSLTPLYNGYAEVVDLLRDEKPEKAAAQFEKTLSLQNDILECIKKYM